MFFFHFIPILHFAQCDRNYHLILYRDTHKHTLDVYVHEKYIAQTKNRIKNNLERQRRRRPWLIHTIHICEQSIQSHLFNFFFGFVLHLDIWPESAHMLWFNVCLCVYIMLCLLMQSRKINCIPVHSATTITRTVWTTNDRSMVRDDDDHQFAVQENSSVKKTIELAWCELNCRAVD